MTGTIGRQLESLATTTSGAASAPTAPASRPPASDEQSMVLLPAGFVGDLISKFAGTIGEIAGGAFGEAVMGRRIGEAAGPLARLLPFTVVPPAVSPQSAGPDAGRGPEQALVVVPAGFLGGLLGGIGGKLLGGTVGDWLGDRNAGQAAGSAIGGVLGGLLPFQVLPPTLAPQSAGPEGAQTQEPMIVVPAGFFGNLLKGVASTIAYASGDKTVRTIATGAAQLSDLIPFQDVPPAMVPQSTGPDGAQQQERMIVLPAGFFGNLLSGFAETIGGTIGDALGDEQTGRDIGAVARPLLELLPFHAVPPQLMPQSAGPGGGTPQELMVVPAGLFGGLLSSFAGAIGGVVGGLAGDARTGSAIGKAAAPLLDLIPFSVVPRPATTGS